MLGTYNFKFDLPNGHRVFVPSEASRLAGGIVRADLARRWRPPHYFFHLREGGHVASLKVHLHHHWFATLDISGFFNSVTRSKVHRALSRVGFDRATAWEIAQQSTVEKTRKQNDFSLPYGFVQSPALASVALDLSSLGRSMIGFARSNQTRLTCYVDDIVLSSCEREPLEHARATLIEAAERSGFAINMKKSQAAGPVITAFNIVLSNGSMLIAEKRMLDFENAIEATANPFVVGGIISYVWTVNPQQVPRLVQIGLASSYQEIRDVTAGFA